VFVAVDDITARYELEQQLRIAETSKERQFQFLLGVLHTAPTELDDFLTVARDQIGTMSSALRAQEFAAATAGQMAIFRQRLETVFRSVHTIKGHAQAMKLTHFVNVCHLFETKLVELRSRATLVGDDFLSVVIAQSELAKDIEELVDVRSRFVSVSAAASDGKERRATDLITAVVGLIERTAEAQGKSVRVDASGFERSRLSDDVRRSIKDVLIQFARNSVTHGIETPDERAQYGKIPLASVTIAARIDPETNHFTLSFRDDGRGLDPDAIKARAVAKGLITLADAQNLPRGAAIGLIFRPGFSTTEVATDDSGRGFGMSIIKDIIVDRLGGKLTMKSEPQRFTEFKIAVPLFQQIEAADASHEEVYA
jgi:chemotaxis protein histidine kinase CheA